ncbi:unnamed protein product [Lactuca virosa]|uniref:Uncharacterized protein n=1 Tax=Lactuca virosa TaxID=75947 RepID=A0AAU9N7R2_9ASTR|nr:unnamed protein product [Lactuca virosa]
MFMSYKIKISNGCGTIIISLVQFRNATNKQLQSGFDHIPTKCSIKSEGNAFKDNVEKLPLHRELYELNPSSFFVPSFINAFMANDDVSRNQSIRNIMSELVPGVFTFDMLHPDFCAKMLAEVENYEKWILETKSSTIRLNTMNK